MDVSEEIRASKFKDEFHKAMVNLYYTYKWYDDILGDLFKSYKILPQHFNVLMILKGSHPSPCSPKDIREVMLDKGRDITRLVDKLVAKGYATRELNPENRRQINIFITDSGQKMVSKMNQELIKKIQSLNNLSEKEVTQLNEILNKLRSQKKK
ncbi:MarR family transcriptional regulator [Phaeodactylibacter sp.]|uniref:MarR family winged helix-turn-helix transcriptional regulator n=1 Tax=Phaeodactylibacter sp. TaxID=1940289 RepID=UPI0025F697D0|nr:MarR family transcriptional regulator [Phaeodactylibacter sp.]MCI4651709.1 MarR family transcriptional regulator [Phaeodactylibacter sp.]MCI5090835.1 MarR family transcriptional regulator [Phaeodactylibacter sp.]